MVTTMNLCSEKNLTYLTLLTLDILLSLNEGYQTIKAWSVLHPCESDFLILQSAVTLLVIAMYIFLILIQYSTTRTHYDVLHYIITIQSIRVEYRPIIKDFSSVDSTNLLEVKRQLALHEWLMRDIVR